MSVSPEAKKPPFVRPSSDLVCRPIVVFRVRIHINILLYWIFISTSGRPKRVAVPEAENLARRPIAACRVSINTWCPQVSITHWLGPSWPADGWEYPRCLHNEFLIVCKRLFAKDRLCSSSSLGATARRSRKKGYFSPKIIFVVPTLVQMAITLKQNVRQSRD